MSTPTMTLDEPETAVPPPPPRRSDAPDPEAPFGRLGNGKPRKTPPRKQGGSRRTAAAGGSPPKRSAPKAPDYRPALQGLFQLVSVPLSFAAPADAWAVTTYAPGICEALNDLAKDRPEVAAMLDRVLQAGPYGAILAAVMPLGLQLAANHGLLPAALAQQLGVPPKDAILASLQQQREQQATEHAAAA